MPSKSIDRTGPMLHIVTRPKLSSCALLPPRTAATPMPSAMMNGTVIGPVVTPPESNAAARDSSGVNAASTNTSP